MKISVLDQGFVNCQEVFGNELTVVNSARVSFGRQKEELGEDDLKLIRYLLRNKHMSPFRHIMFRFHIKAPEFVMRQWYKHVIGAEWSTGAPMHAWNEISGRYVPLTEFYVPVSWRQQSESCKQGSQGEVVNEEECHRTYQRFLSDMVAVYEDLLASGVAKEQARIVLPLSVYTEAIWTCSFQAVMNFLELRLDPHAQQEIREFAQAVQTIVRDALPTMCEIWEKED